MKNNRKNIFQEKGKVTYKDRCKILNQKGIVLWFTGLSGSGKSTIAIELEKKLTSMNKKVYRLDGDNIRLGLNSDLGFSEEDRNENIRRITEVAYLFKDAGLVTIVVFISPYKKMRKFAKDRIGKDSFYEIYIKADIKTCEARDPKGLYKKVKSHKIDQFTGISSIYEEPENPDLVLDTTKLTVDESVDKIIENIFK